MMTLTLWIGVIAVSIVLEEWNKRRERGED